MRPRRYRRSPDRADPIGLTAGSRRDLADRGSPRADRRPRKHQPRVGPRHRCLQFERSHDSGRSTTAAPKSGRWRRSIEAGAKLSSTDGRAQAVCSCSWPTTMSGRLGAKISRLMRARAISSAQPSLSRSKPPSAPVSRDQHRRFALACRRVRSARRARDWYRRVRGLASS